MQTLFDIPVRTLEGKETDLSPFKGKVLLIVNVASQCGFTPQYKELQEIYKDLNARGLEILGFPCNDFGQQELERVDEIRRFCENHYAITFPLFEKIRILGSGAHPLYIRLLSENLPVMTASGFKSFVFRIIKPFIYLLKGMPSPHPNGVEWNFHKFLVNRKGKPVCHFASDVGPQNSMLKARIEQELGL